METKLDLLKKHWASGDKISALRIAARFPRLGAHKATITRGWEAHVRPDFFRQLGKNPSDLIESAFAALVIMYNLDSSL